MRTKTLFSTGIALVVLLLSLAPVAASDTPEEEFGDLVGEFDDLVGEIGDFVDEFDDFVAKVLEDPDEFDEEFAELAEEFLEFVEEFDEVFDELAEEFAQFATPASVPLTSLVFGAPTEVLSIGDNLIITQPITATHEGSLIVSEVGTIRTAVKASTGEFILQGTTVVTGMLPDGESGTLFEHVVVMGALGRVLLSDGTGGLANVLVLLSFGDFTGLIFDLDL